MSRTLTGTPASPGIAVGPVARMASSPGALPPAHVVTDTDKEAQRAAEALEATAVALEERRDRAAGEAAAILDTQALMARDFLLAEAVATRTGRGEPAEHAIDGAFADLRAQLAALGGYMAERAADLGDLRDRAVSHLLGLPMPGVPRRAAPFVLVAEDLAPADTVDLDPALVLALVTVEGGPTSHTAIIARALGIPGGRVCRGAADLPDDAAVVVDGEAGSVAGRPAGRRGRGDVARGSRARAPIGGRAGARPDRRRASGRAAA